MPKAPHLPKEVAKRNYEFHFKKIGFILFFFLIAWFSGFTGALMVIGWFTPEYNSPTVVRFDKTPAATPDPFLVKQVSERTVRIYDSRKKIENKFYSDEAFVARAAIVSSDGWLVSYIPKNLLGQEKYWEIIDSQGLIYKVKRVVLDSFSHLSYLKVDNQNGFRITTLGSVASLAKNSSFWQVNNANWSLATVHDYLEVGISSKKDLPIWQPVFTRVLDGNLASSVLLFDSQGNLLGFTKETGEVISIIDIKDQVNNILAGGKLQYFGFDVSGYLIKKAQVNGSWQEINGYYISQSKYKTGENNLIKGDVILKINKESIDEYFINEQVLSASDPVEVLVLRDGNEVLLRLSKIAVYP